MLDESVADEQDAAALAHHTRGLALRLCNGGEALIEPLVWQEGRIRRDTDAVVLAAVIAHDLGAPIIKVPVPAASPGAERQQAVARVVASVGVPVLFLGGPRSEAGATGSSTKCAT